MLKGGEIHPGQIRSAHALPEQYIATNDEMLRSAVKNDVAHAVTGREQYL